MRGRTQSRRKARVRAKIDRNGSVEVFGRYEGEQELTQKVIIQLTCFVQVNRAVPLHRTNKIVRTDFEAKHREETDLDSSY